MQLLPVVEPMAQISPICSIMVAKAIGTMAMIMNTIPHVINARPGLKTMIDIPVPRAIMGDMRDLIEEDCKLVK